MLAESCRFAILEESTSHFSANILQLILQYILFKDEGRYNGGKIICDMSDIRLAQLVNIWGNERVVD